MTRKIHMSINIIGLLNQYKRKRIDFFEHDDGKRMTDADARSELKRRMDLGHKLICVSNDCDGFDPFEKGCPGHPIVEINEVKEVQP